ncbi:MAG TPA: GAF and ANTAR domain-containing protein [Intrasporangium sp.]|uniref:GAF and ANTAR domain-containing protein n=1 Tax=Intrasporangium sp. TaxID=1925024 RepID=UPI002D790829|nr:GAF and ANTAR domain-containing protein [Intrasporangium sp.]HET7398299.1 GAF and ANTAR domain-containing protein [Intrasporangium sp.]
MPHEVPADSAIKEAFSGLSQLIYSGADTASVHQALVEAAPRFVEGCDRASILMLVGDRFRSTASTDEVAQHIDMIELETGEGPCLDAIADEAVQHIADLRDGTSPWPAFTRRVLAETPVRSSAGYRLLLEGRKVGALNVFSDTPGALDEEAANAGAVLAAFASVSLMAAAARAEADTLRAGLESNREIGKAVGLLMAAHKVPAEEAFDILKRTSQDLNMKLAQVAAQVVEGQQGQFRGP